MSFYLFKQFVLKPVSTNTQLFNLNARITLRKQMAKNVSQSATVNAALGKQNRLKIKGKSKFPPGIVKFQVLGSGANGAPRCLYLFTDHAR